MAAFIPFAQVSVSAACTNAGMGRGSLPAFAATSAGKARVCSTTRYFTDGSVRSGPGLGHAEPNGDRAVEYATKFGSGQGVWRDVTQAWTIGNPNVNGCCEKDDGGW